MQKQRMKEEWMQTWKIRISWNMKQNSISGGAFVFDCTIRYRIFHLDHFQLLLNEWISRKTVDGKEAIRKRRPQRFTHSRIWNEFFHYDFLLQEAGTGNWNLGEKWMLIVRLIYEERSFDFVGKYVLYKFFSTLSTLLSWMFSSFQIFNFFQPFSTFFPSVFNFFQLCS